MTKFDFLFCLQTQRCLNTFKIMLNITANTITSVSVMANLRGLQEKTKKMADKLREAAHKIDSLESTCRTIKAGGEGISVAAGCT